MDFKRNKESVSFQKTISLVTGLIGELDMKQKKIKARKKIAAVWKYYDFSQWYMLLIKLMAKILKVNIIIFKAQNETLSFH